MRHSSNGGQWPEVPCQSPRPVTCLSPTEHLPEAGRSMQRHWIWNASSSPRLLCSTFFWTPSRSKYWTKPDHVQLQHLFGDLATQNGAAIATVRQQFSNVMWPFAATNWGSEWPGQLCLRGDNSWPLRGTLSDDPRIEAIVQAFLVIGPSTWLLFGTPVRIAQLYGANLVILPNRQGYLKTVSRHSQGPLLRC